MPIVGLLPSVGRLVINGGTQGCMARGLQLPLSEPSIKARVGFKISIYGQFHIIVPLANFPKLVNFHQKLAILLLKFS